MAPGVLRSDLGNRTGGASSESGRAAGARRENVAEDAERIEFDQRRSRSPVIEIRQEDIDEFLSDLLIHLREAEINKERRHRERMAAEERRHEATIAILNQLTTALRERHQPPVYDA